MKLTFEQIDAMTQTERKAWIAYYDRKARRDLIAVAVCSVATFFACVVAPLAVYYFA